jgi:hypothetical protein
MAGQILGFVWTVTVWFFLLLFVGVPIARHRWKASERRDAEATETVLSRTQSSEDDTHIWDAL